MGYGASSYVILKGNVGIGTTGPTSKLHVFGTSNSGNIMAQIDNAGTGANTGSAIAF